jgi:hypothetical protein
MRSGGRPDETIVLPGRAFAALRRHRLLDEIAPLLPALAEVPDRTRLAPRDLFSLLTVATLCLMIERQRLTES